jgi:hypothetical protein
MATKNATRPVGAPPRPVAAAGGSGTLPPARPPGGPTGRKLASNIGPGVLCPGAGKQVQRTGVPLYCGTMTGLAFAVNEHPNTRDPNRISLRFAGQIMAITAKGDVLRGAEWYLPNTVGRAVKAALGVNVGRAVPFSIEIWCEPDEEGRPASPLGYSYASYDRVPAREDDPLMALAYDAGILERPQASQLALPMAEEAGEDGIDPETGEIVRVDPPLAEAAD